MMMGRLRSPLAVCLLGVLIFLTPGKGFAQTNALVPPAGDEAPPFPQWTRDLRRGEIIAIGAFPFSYFFASISVDLYRSSQHNWDSRYYPWIFKSAGAVDMTKDEQFLTIAVAAGGAVLIALADFIILQVKRNRAARVEVELPPGDPIIIRRPWPPGEEAGEGPEI